MGKKALVLPGVTVVGGTVNFLLSLLMLLHIVVVGVAGWPFHFLVY
jgi:hypothetical protein